MASDIEAQPSYPEASAPTGPVAGDVQSPLLTYEETQPQQETISNAPADPAFDAYLKDLESTFQSRAQQAAVTQARAGAPRIPREQSTPTGLLDVERAQKAQGSYGNVVRNPIARSIVSGAGDIVKTPLEIIAGAGRGFLTGAAKALDELGPMPSSDEPPESLKEQIGNIYNASYALVHGTLDEAAKSGADALGVREVGAPQHGTGRDVIKEIGLSDVFPENTLAGRIADAVFYDPVGSIITMRAAYSGLKAVTPATLQAIHESAVKGWEGFARIAKRARAYIDSEDANSLGELTAHLRRVREGGFVDFGKTPKTTVAAGDEEKSLATVLIKAKPGEAGIIKKGEQYVDKYPKKVKPITPDDPLPLPRDNAVEIVQNPLSPDVLASLKKKPLSDRDPYRLSPEEEIERAQRMDAIRGTNPPLPTAYHNLATERSVVQEVNGLYSLIDSGEVSGSGGISRWMHERYSAFLKPTVDTVNQAINDGVRTAIGMVKREVDLAPGGQKFYQNTMERIRGEAAIYQDAIRDVGKRIEKLFPSSGDRVYLQKLVNGTGDDLATAYWTHPAHYEMATEIIRAEHDFGDLMVQLGAMSREAFEKFDAIHLRRFYDEHIAGKGGKVLREGRLYRLSPEEAGGIKMRKAISPEAAAAMGEQLDILKTAPRDLSAQAFIVVKTKLKNVIEKYYLKDEPLPGYEQIEAGEWAGKWAPEYIARDMDFGTGWLKGAQEKTLASSLMKLWKLDVTVFNSATSDTNFLSNFRFADLAGASLYTPKGIQVLKASIQDYLSNGFWTKVSTLSGELGSSFAEARLGAKDAIREWSGIAETRKPENFIEQTYQWLTKGEGVQTYPVKVYRAADDVMKIATHRYLVEVVGMTHAEATESVLKFMQHYNRLPEWVGKAANTMAFTPFLAFRAEQFRITVNALHDPRALWSLAKWSIFRYAMHKAALSEGIISEDDLKRAEKYQSEARERFGTLFSPAFVTPFTLGGSPWIFDMSRVDPIQGIFETLATAYGTAKAIKKGEDKEIGRESGRLISLLGIAQRPEISLAVKWLANYDPYTGRQIVPEDAPRSAKIWRNFVKSTLDTLSPPITPFVGRDFQKIQAGFRGEPMQGQRTIRSAIESVLDGVLGLNVQKLDEEQKTFNARISSREARIEREQAIATMKAINPRFQAPDGLFALTSIQEKEYELLGKIHAADLRGDRKAADALVAASIPGIFKNYPEFNKKYERYLLPQATQFFITLDMKGMDNMNAQNLIQNPENQQAMIDAKFFLLRHP